MKYTIIPIDHDFSGRSFFQIVITPEVLNLAMGKQNWYVLTATKKKRTSKAPAPMVLFIAEISRVDREHFDGQMPIEIARYLLRMFRRSKRPFTEKQVEKSIALAVAQRLTGADKRK